MKTCRVIAGSILIMASNAIAQGSLTPPGAPAETMKTLEEIYQKLTNTLAEVQTTQVQVADLQARMIAMGMLPTTDGMVLISAGDFVMGDTFDEGDSDEFPLHTNTLSAFYMDATEVTKTKWDEVYTWATNNGYAFDNAGSGKDMDHPVHTVNWYDCVKWANARSEMDGFAPCYTTNDATYKTGTSDDVVCNWSAVGYRLPTEAEWEKAARGGTANRRFSWSAANTIQHTRANYYADPGSPTYDTSGTSGYHPDFIPYTSPVGWFVPNGYGLHDMTGNLYEWCWDWYGYTYYASSPGTDPHGPAPPGSGLGRVRRGCHWGSKASRCRVADRDFDSPGLRGSFLGFRLVRAAP